MANEQFYTYNADGTRTVQIVGDYGDVIVNINRKEHPILALLAAQYTGDIYPNVVTDSLLAVDTSNAYGEGDAAPAATDTTRGLVGNYTQLFYKTAEVSDTKRTIAQYGIEDEFAYQKGKKLIELLRDIEGVMVGDQAAQAPTAANSHIAKMTGISAFITSHTSAAFAEAALDTILNAVWASGGQPTDIFAKTAHITSMQAFVTGVTVNVDASTRARGAPISTYNQPIGPAINITPHYLLPQDKVTAGAEVLILQPSLWPIKERIPLTWKELPDTGAGPAGTWKYQLCVLAKAEEGNAMFTA